MDEQQKRQAEKYLDILVRHKRLIYLCIFLCVLSGIVIYCLVPKVYRATALLIYEQQKINPSRMAPDLTSKTKDIVATLMQQVTSRTSLEKIIKEFELYLDLRKSLPLEDVIEEMKEDIVIVPTTGDIFEVSYEGDSPDKVLKVTNALSSQFIEENIKYREEKASDAAEYIDHELELAQQSLNVKEEAMRDYKLHHYNEMPEQQESNVSRFNTLQLKLQGVQQNTQELQRTRIMVQEQIAAQKKFLQENLLAQAGAQSDPSAQNSSQQLASLKAKLNFLLTKYKENHPEIKHLRKMIASLEQEMTRSGYSLAQLTDLSSPGHIPAGGGSLVTDLEIQIKSIDLNLLSLKEETSNLHNQIDKIEQWISQAPNREAEWSALTRDYAEFKRHYDYLVAQDLQAESTENLERKQKGSQFKIVDPARLPETPVKPDFFKIMAAAVVAGLLVGGGLALGLELVDTSFRNPAEIEDYLGIGVGCSIPYLQTNPEKKRAHLGKIMGYVWVTLSLLTVAGLIYYLYDLGVIMV